MYILFKGFVPQNPESAKTRSNCSNDFVVPTPPTCMYFGKKECCYLHAVRRSFRLHTLQTCATRNQGLTWWQNTQGKTPFKLKMTDLTVRLQKYLKGSASTLPPMISIISCVSLKGAFSAAQQKLDRDKFTVALQCVSRSENVEFVTCGVCPNID